MDLLYLLNELTQNKFHANEKVVEEMRCLTLYAPWREQHPHLPLSCTNDLLIATLSTCSFHVHVDDILQDDDLMSSTILYFQETHLHNVPTNHEFSKFNLNITYVVHGLLSCIQKNIEVISIKTFSNKKIEIILTNIHATCPLSIMIIHVARFAHVPRVIETIAITKTQSTHKKCIYLIVGDFNIGIYANRHRHKQLMDYMQSQQLQEITKKYNKKTKTLIDHIWANFPAEHCDISIQDTHWTDHDAIHAPLHFM